MNIFQKRSNLGQVKPCTTHGNAKRATIAVRIEQMAGGAVPAASWVGVSGAWLTVLPSRALGSVPAFDPRNRFVLPL